MIGERFGPWVIDAEIGRGAMGSVYRAHCVVPDASNPWQQENAPGALKVLSAELARDDLFVQRFQREVEALGQLDHPNIVRFFGAGEHKGTYYYAMEFIDGVDCEKRLAQSGPLDWPEVFDIATAVVTALKHAHDRGIIHRDLKPANILLAEVDGKPVVKLTDFGVAKLFSRPGLTAAGNFVGTAAYISPEQAQGKPATKRSDFYSLGGVLYCLLAGRPPFTGDNAVELLHKHCHSLPDRLQRLVPGLPHDVDAFVMQLLEKEPNRRPADGLVIARMIERLRAKIERKQAAANGSAADNVATLEQSVLPTGTLADRSRGPATVVADLMREELTEMNKGGPLARLFNHPIAVIAMLAACVGLIVFGLTRHRPSAEELLAKAQPLMESENPADWDRAWRDYLEPLEERYPSHPQKAEVALFRLHMLDCKEQDRAAKAERVKSEGERFYKLGLALLAAGDADGARRYWQNVANSFRGIAGEERWVAMAERGLRSLPAADPNRDDTARTALARARTLRDTGKRAQANEVWAALEDLYRDDPRAAPLLRELRRDRDGK